MPLITLLSDFGSQSVTPASVEGLIYQYIKNARVITINNQVAPYNLQQAAYLFKQSFKNFPEDTFHFIMVDLYGNTSEEIIYVYENKQHILCPNNGFITMLFQDSPVKLFKLNATFNEAYHAISLTKKYLEAVEAILQNEKEDVMDEVTADDILIKKSSQAFYNNNVLNATVLYIDNFENVVLNVTKAYFEEVSMGRNFKLRLVGNDEITKISTQYNSVSVGEKLCRFNSANYLEIAINKGNAAGLFGFNLQNENSLLYQQVKIFFE